MNFPERDLPIYLQLRPFIIRDCMDIDWIGHRIYTFGSQIAKPKPVTKKLTDNDDSTYPDLYEVGLRIFDHHLQTLNIQDDFALQEYNKPFVQYTRRHPGPCPVDGEKTHDRLGAWFSIKDKRMIIGCYSQRCKGHHKYYKIKSE